MAHAVPLEVVQIEMQDHPSGVLLRTIVIGLTAFLTVVDLFATQAILPTLTRAYQVTPAAMGFAVNSSTMGMAVAGLVVSLFSQRINHRLGILISLSVLSIPTALLAVAPDLTTFTVLRIAQGLCMASAFTLTLAYLGEECSAADAGGAFAAYITGNVASNLIGRLVSAAVADHLGLAANFYFFAALNLAGAVLVYCTVAQSTPMMQMEPAARSLFAAWMAHLRNPPLRAAFGIGFCILFAFIGTFTYVNFVLVRPPLSLGPMQLGFVYFVFLPSVATTLLAGGAVHRWGTRPTLWGSLALAGVGLPLLLLPNLTMVLLGMVLIGIGTFFAQATATGFVSLAATADRGAASGIYLACYFAGGLIGTAILGQVFDRLGWGACVGGIALPSAWQHCSLRQHRTTSSLMQQAIPAQAGGDYAMTSHSTMPEQPQSETETAVQLFDNWFDPIEAGLRDRAREFLQAMLEAELDEVLDRSRYARRAKRPTGESEKPAGVTGHRHGHRSRTLLGTFGQLKIEVPRARLDTSDGKTTEWKSQALRAYQRRTLAADALIAGCYLAGTNTRRVRRALGALFRGAVGKDVVSRVWRKVKSDWEAWNARSLAQEPIVRLILDGTVVRVRLDRQATSISLLVIMGVRADAIAAVWDSVPVQRCTVHKHRNLLAHAPERLHEEISADYNAVIYAATREELERQRKAFIRKWRLKHHPVADSLQEAGERLFTFTRLPLGQWRSARTTNAIERLHEEFKRRIKTQTVLPSADTAAMLFWALLASGQISMRKIDGWHTLATKLIDQPIDLAA